MLFKTFNGCLEMGYGNRVLGKGNASQKFFTNRFSKYFIPKIFYKILLIMYQTNDFPKRNSLKIFSRIFILTNFACT